MSDNNAAVVHTLCNLVEEREKIFGDAGYVSKKIFEMLYEQGLQLITKIRKNMKNELMILQHKLLLRRRSLVETVIDQLKNWMD